MAETISTGSKAGAAVLGPLLTTLDLPAANRVHRPRARKSHTLDDTLYETVWCRGSLPQAVHAVPA